MTRATAVCPCSWGSGITPPTGCGCDLARTWTPCFTRRTTAPSRSTTATGASSSARACGSKADRSPASPLPQRLDHLAQPAGRVAPVSVDRPPRPLGAAGRDLLDDPLVLHHRARDLIDERAGIEPDVALRLRLPRSCGGSPCRGRRCAWDRGAALRLSA